MAKSEAQIREELVRELQTAGGLKAYRTAMQICDDPKATAAAKASAVNSLFRAGGFFDKQEVPTNKAPHEMTAEEISREIGRLRSTAKNIHQSSDDVKAENTIQNRGIFG